MVAEGSCAAGKVTVLIFQNVRCVPSFGYTLLSVKQMWREQRIRSRLEELCALKVPSPRGTKIVPFMGDRELPSIKGVSALRILSIAPKALTALPVVSTPSPKAADATAPVPDSLPPPTHERDDPPAEAIHRSL